MRIGLQGLELQAESLALGADKQNRRETRVSRR
jgi:hypothetical protein